MAQSLNTSVYYTAKASYVSGIPSTGHVMAGDKSFEYYNEANTDDFVQIPWVEIDHVAASVLLGGRVIPRFVIFTRSAGHFAFSARNNHECLRAIREHVDANKIVRSKSFWDVFKQGIKAVSTKVAARFGHRS